MLKMVIRTQVDIYVYTTLWYTHGEIKTVFLKWTEGEKESSESTRHQLKPKCAGNVQKLKHCSEVC